jgi:xanthine dehydrogenase YagS FAD-binding subunit
MLVDGAPTPANFARVAEAYESEARGYPGNAFKMELARRAIPRALEQAFKMERNDDKQLHRTTTEPR